MSEVQPSRRYSFSKSDVISMERRENSELNAVERKVRPVGNLLNDNDGGVDELDYLVYAEALGKLLHNCHPPVTVGIFGPWGIGKTFLLKHIQGLLRKYEQQDKCDADCLKKRKVQKSKRFRLQNVTEEDGTNDMLQEEMALKKPVNKTRRTNLKRGWTNVCWTLLIFVIIGILLALLIMCLLLGLKSNNDLGLPKQNRTEGPRIDSIKIGKCSATYDNRQLFYLLIVDGGETRSGSDGGVRGRIVPHIPGNCKSIPREFLIDGYVFFSEIGNLTEGSGSTRIATTTAIPDGQEREVIADSVRLYLILAAVLVAAMVFGAFCCCIANTSSKCWPRFLNNYKLILYAAFTRLPTVSVLPTTNWMEADNPYMVTHFNDDVATLHYLDPGDDEYIENARINSRKMPTKYIFVNYHAWQYAGSDTLWAGIVTNLSEAIETEFGAVCARLFRMMQVERPSKSGSLKRNLRKKEDPRSLYVQIRFPDDSSWNIAKKRERVETIMRDYGVVSQCSIYKRPWWFVRFCRDKEANYAERALKLHNYEVSRIRPDEGKMTHDPTSLHENIATDRRDSGEPDTPLMRQQPSVRVSRGSGDIICDIPMTALPTQEGRDDPLKGDETVPGGVSAQGKQRTLNSEKSGCCSSCSCCRCFKHFHSHPKTVCCGCPFFYCCILFVVAAIMFPTTVVILAQYLELGVLKSTRAIPIEVQIFSWLPAVLGILIVALRFCWAMCNSQTERIRKALAGTSGSMGNALGFMNDVKREVMVMTDLINCVRFTHGINYKIIITIDDLDRCPHDKVKSVVQAVSILLSDRASPFLCLIAVDSRIAVKCIEQDMGEVLLNAHLTGHEYLKKIINLPFCLPEVANNAKKRYFGGIMDSADDTVLKSVPMNETDNSKDALKVPTHDFLDAVEREVARTDQIDQTNLTSTDGLGGSGSDRAGFRDLTVSPRDEQIPDEKEFSAFLFRCREVLDGVGPSGRFVHEHVCGNPRNMKRIFNVLSLTTRLIRCIQQRRVRRGYLALHSRSSRLPAQRGVARKPSIVNSDLKLQRNAIGFGKNPEDADDLVRWVVVTDQWPYRISYVLQVVEDFDHRRDAGLDEPFIKQDCTLAIIYETYVEHEIANQPNFASMSPLDQDPALLRSFLRGSPSLTRGRVASLFPVTLNLDQCLRNGISRERCTANLPNVPTAD